LSIFRYNLTGHNAIAKAEADEIVDALGDLATLVFPAYKVGLICYR
jgi:hypothetical protein